jgi:hypothetical protein
MSNLVVFVDYFFYKSIIKNLIIKLNKWSREKKRLFQECHLEERDRQHSYVG